jgi:hypothetical protein
MLSKCPTCAGFPTVRSTNDGRAWLEHLEEGCQLRRREQYMSVMDAEAGWNKTCQYFMQRNLRTERKTIIDKVVWERCEKEGKEVEE